MSSSILSQPPLISTLSPLPHMHTSLKSLSRVPAYWSVIWPAEFNQGYPCDHMFGAIHWSRRSSSVVGQLKIMTFLLNSLHSQWWRSKGRSAWVTHVWLLIESIWKGPGRVTAAAGRLCAWRMPLSLSSGSYILSISSSPMVHEHWRRWSCLGLGPQSTLILSIFGDPWVPVFMAVHCKEGSSD